jgi:hypothetical protein
MGMVKMSGRIFVFAERVEPHEFDEYAARVAELERVTDRVHQAREQVALTYRSRTKRKRDRDAAKS